MTSVTVSAATGRSESRVRRRARRRVARRPGTRIISQALSAAIMMVAAPAPALALGPGLARLQQPARAASTTPPVASPGKAVNSPECSASRHRPHLRGKSRNTACASLALAVSPSCACLRTCPAQDQNDWSESRQVRVGCVWAWNAHDVGSATGRKHVIRGKARGTPRLGSGIRRSGHVTCE